MIRQKINDLTVKDVISFSQEHNMDISSQQAKNILTFVKKSDLNPFSEKDRLKLLKKIALISDQKTAQKANQLFKQMIKTYGVENYFK